MLTEGYKKDEIETDNKIGTEREQEVFFKEITDDIEEIKKQNMKVIVMGDFNAKLIEDKE